MKIVRRLFDFYINSSIHVALAVVSFIFITQMTLRLSVPHALYAFVFLGTITGYNFVKYASVAGLHHRSLVFSLKIIQVFSFLCALPLVYLVFQLSLHSLWVLAICGGLTFFYAVPLLHRKNLRTFAGLKIIIVALVWALATVLLPVVESVAVLDTDVYITIAQRFILVIVLIIPFEIRDFHYDDKVLQTLPQKMGLVSSKITGVILLLIMLLLEGFKDIVGGVEISALTLISIILVLLLIKSSHQQSKYYASFFVEAIPIVWALILCSARI